MAKQNFLKRLFPSTQISKHTAPLDQDIFFTPATFSGSLAAKVLSVLGASSKVNINTQTKQGQQDAYDLCPIVGTIAERRGDYLLSGVLRAVNSEGKDVNTSEVKAAMRLLENPNPMMDREEFLRAMAAYYDVFGYCPVLKVYPANRTTGLPTALWPIAPINFSYELTGKLYDQSTIQGIVKMVEYTNPGGANVRLTGMDIDRVWIFNGKTFRKEDPYTAQSPIYSASDAVNLFNVGMNVYARLIKQSIAGIISQRERGAVQAIPMKPDEKKEVQQKLSDRYGLVEDRDQFLITNKDLFFQSLLTNIGNLALPEGFKMAMDTICDRMGFQPELLSQKDATFENKKNAEIIQYTSQTIPFSEKLAATLNGLLSASGFSFLFDFSHLSILQESESDRMAALNTLSSSMAKLVNAQIITAADAKRVINELTSVQL